MVNGGELWRNSLITIFKLFKIKTKNKPAKIITPAKQNRLHGRSMGMRPVPCLTGQFLIKAKKGSEERFSAGQTSR